VSSTAGIKRDDTVDETEVARFAAMAAEWWDPGGTMRMLHRLNPVRLAFIKEALCRQFSRDGRRLDVLAGLRILDIGCGAGILSEPLKRMGAEVVGADPSTANIAVATQHARQAGLAIDYRATTVEALADVGELFEAVLAMEVVEHVADLSLFVGQCAQLVKPGGILVVATINRTLKSFALAIVGAEYLLRWLPRGTHRWDKLVTPEELAAAIEEGGLTVIEQTGVIYNLLADRWQLSSDLDVNYMMSAQKPGHA
jgi:2-polyprenyl-6-hydroxyphenyl methylase/3-demethylubiquinone-9 3-methyltransferase